MQEHNYNQPFDAALLPEGVERCSLGAFILHLVPAFAVLLWGAYAAFTVLAFGLGTTGLDDYFGFGLWIAFDLAVIALGAGAFFTGALRYLFNIEQLKHIINLAVATGFLCYSGAMLVLTLDIGQPLRAWFGYWHPNVHSMLTEVIFCITCYCLVLAIELVPLKLENRLLLKNKFAQSVAHNFHVIMPLFAGIGVFLSTFHQGSLGGMFGVLFGRPYLLRDGFFIWPWTFFLYILSAVGAGPLFTVLVATFMEKITGKRLVSWDVKLLLGKIAGIMFSVYMVFKLIDTAGWIFDILPRSGMTFDQMFYGWIYGKWLLYAELIIGGLIPAYLLLSKKFREQPQWFYTAAALACLGVIINRYVMTVQALAIPVMPFDSWQFYAPNWAEWAASLLVIAYGWICLALAYRYLPLFPQERELQNVSASSCEKDM